MPGMGAFGELILGDIGEVSGVEVLFVPRARLALRMALGEVDLQLRTAAIRSVNLGMTTRMRMSLRMSGGL